MVRNNVPYRNSKKRRQYSRNYYKKHRKKYLAYGKTWSANNREHVTKHNRIYKFGLTPEMFNQLWESQNGSCAICKRSLSRAWEDRRKPDGVCVDHDHATGIVRGLLCVMCNRGLGFFKEPRHLLTAYTYLCVERSAMQRPLLVWKWSPIGSRYETTNKRHRLHVHFHRRGRGRDNRFCSYWTWSIDGDQAHNKRFSNAVEAKAAAEAFVGLNRESDREEKP
jgi:hypothetical protein